MGKSATIIWGPLKIEKTLVTDGSVEEADKTKIVAITLFDCFPPPGSVAEYVHPASFPPEVLERYVQQSERADLRAVYRQFGKGGKNSDAILKEISDRLDFVDMPINYTGERYRKMRRVTKCFKTTLYLRVEYRVYQVKITANQKIKIGDKTFPVADEIATYRVRQPTRFRFETQHEYNPRCCPEKPAKKPKAETTEWYTPFHSALDDWDLRIPLRWRLKDWRWKIMPEFEVEEEDDGPRIKLKLKYRF